MITICYAIALYIMSKADLDVEMLAAFLLVTILIDAALFAGVWIDIARLF